LFQAKGSRLHFLESLKHVEVVITLGVVFYFLAVAWWGFNMDHARLKRKVVKRSLMLLAVCSWILAGMAGWLPVGVEIMSWHYKKFENSGTKNCKKPSGKKFRRFILDGFKSSRNMGWESGLSQPIFLDDLGQTVRTMRFGPNCSK
jgi:hypothetical protein